MKIGFIGLGMMGKGMAANLQKAGHDLVVYDLSKAAADRYVEKGATWAATPRAVAESVDLVFTSLPTPAVVEMVCNGPDGLAKGFRKGTAWFDFSTNALDVVRRLNAQLKPVGVEFLDAPISGGPGGAASGKLAILVGGDRATWEKHERVMRQMADMAQYIGEIGAGTITKLAHNMASTAIKAVIAEVITMGVKAGMDPLDLWKAMRSGAAGRMRGFDNVQRFLAGNVDDPSFALRLMQKDINLALQLGRELDVPMRVCAAVGQDVHEAMARGWGGKDSQAVLVLQSERAGIDPIAIPEADLKRALAAGD
jgi:3-hydroxyisobutyrate dehydrogenase